MQSLWWRVIRYGFYLLYHPLAWTYDLVSGVVSLGVWREWQRAGLRFIDPKGLTLDLAHGTGNLQLDLHAQSTPTVGLDYSPQMGRIAQRKLHDLLSVAQLVRGEGENLPFADATFQNVISTFPTNFIFLPETLRGIHRVLKPDGVLVIVPSSAFTSGGLLRRILEFAYRVTGQKSGESESAETILEGEMSHYIRKYGFTVRVEQVVCPHSVAFVVIARKQGIAS